MFAATGADFIAQDGVAEIEAELKMFFPAHFQPRVSVRTPPRSRPPVSTPTRPEGAVVAGSPCAPCAAGKTLFIEVCSAPVVRLLARRRPPDVSRFVVPVYIDSIERVRRRRLVADVRKEPQEVVPPLLADPNATTAVVMPIFLIRILAALDHREPRTIFGRPHAADRVPMLESGFLDEMPARTRPAPQMISGYHSRLPAIAATSPRLVAIAGGARPFDCGKQAKPLPD